MKFVLHTLFKIILQLILYLMIGILLCEGNSTEYLSYSSKVVGGTPIPYQVLKSAAHIRITGEKKGGGTMLSSCSGTLISGHHVITAAHCVGGIGDRTRIRKVEICLGQKYYRQCIWKYTVIRQFMPHISSRFKVEPPDIAVLKFTGDYDKQYISKMKVMNASYERILKRQDPVSAFIAGSGGTVFKTISVSILSKETCFIGPGVQNMMPNEEICAHAKQQDRNQKYNGYGLQMGDSGGSLYVMRQETPVLYGVSSMYVQNGYGNRKLCVFANARRFRMDLKQIIRSGIVPRGWKNKIY